MTTRVLHLMDVLRPSGAETTLAVAGPRWAVRGVDADVLAMGEELGPYAPTLRDAGYRTGHLPMDPFPRFARRLRKLLVDDGYDAVHNHEERANLYVAMVARSAGVRVVQSLHGLWDFDGRLRAERRAMRLAMRRMGVTFVAVSEAVAANERERFANPARVITNWFDDAVHRPPTPAERRAARAGLELSNDAVVVASVGNCEPVKNHVSILEALAALGRDDVVYLHAGTGPDTDAETRLAVDLGIGDRVRFLGHIAAAPVLRAADAFVMPSLREGQGIAAIEAVATAVPAVLAASPGLRTLNDPDLDLAVEWVEPTTAGVTAGLAAVLDAPPPEARLRESADAVAAAFGPDRPLDALTALYKGE